MSEHYDNLIAALAGIPDLKRGLCVGDDPTLWDETVDVAIIERNKQICAAPCPELAKCHAWSKTQRRGKLLGTIAGRVHPEPVQKAAS